MKRIILFFILLLFSVVSFSQTTARLLPKKGLFVNTSTLNWITGSDFNFFSFDKKEQRYFFTWWEQDADSSQQGRDMLSIGSANTAVEGMYTLQQHGATTDVILNCRYNYPDSAVAEIIHARIWMPYLKESSFEVAGNKIMPDSISTFDDTAFTLATPFGNFRLSSSHPFRMARNDAAVTGKNAYTKRDQYLVLYESGITVTNAIPLNRRFTITQTGIAKSFIPISKTVQVVPEKITDAWIPPFTMPQILPKPVVENWSENQHYIIERVVVNNNSFTAKRYLSLLSQKWQLQGKFNPNINTIIQPSLEPEAYTIDIKTDGITIAYSTTVGLQYALYSLVQLTVVRNNGFQIPVGKVKDKPRTNWRGIHMFTGTESLAFHKKMFDKILLPLKINKTVLQCEQAKWKSFPNLHNSISISTTDLKSEFDYLRANHVEPVPLIQSLGHMEWFFKPKGNRFMAINPKYPYTINPLLSEARKAVYDLWNEAVTLLKPSVMHIGFDEIGMIGFNEPRENEIDYWKIQIAYLDSLSKKFNTKLMLWGDMGLAPSEGPDACNGKTAARAALIRGTIPKGSYIADWHYLGNPDPSVYKKNLQLWKREGLKPIASPWYDPDNIKGFTTAAIEENAGVLQTTWADFESSEKNMLRNIEQFGAYILALDYAWSGRKELPGELPYNAIEKWNQLYFDQAKPMNKRHGWRLPTGSIHMTDISTTSQKGFHEYSLRINQALQIGGWKLSAVSSNILPEGEPIAIIEFYHGNRLVRKHIIRYGIEVRAGNDARAIFASLEGKEEKAWYQFLDKKSTISRITIRSVHPAAGLAVNEFVLIN